MKLSLIKPVTIVESSSMSDYWTGLLTHDPLTEWTMLDLNNGKKRTWNF